MQVREFGGTSKQVIQEDRVPQMKIPRSRVRIFGQSPGCRLLNVTNLAFHAKASSWLLSVPRAPLQRRFHTAHSLSPRPCATSHMSQTHYCCRAFSTRRSLCWGCSSLSCRLTFLSTSSMFHGVINASCVYLGALSWQPYQVGSEVGWMREWRQQRHEGNKGSMGGSSPPGTG